MENQIVGSRFESALSATAGVLLSLFLLLTFNVGLLITMALKIYEIEIASVIFISYIGITTCIVRAWIKLKNVVDKSSGE